VSMSFGAGIRGGVARDHGEEGHMRVVLDGRFDACGYGCGGIGGR
jgi:hypothetical protein